MKFSRNKNLARKKTHKFFRDFHLSKNTNFQIMDDHDVTLDSLKQDQPSLKHELLSEGKVETRYIDVKNANGFTALNMACKRYLEEESKNRKQIICTLLLTGAKVLIPDNSDQYPFDYCRDSELKPLLATYAAFEFVKGKQHDIALLHRINDSGAHWDWTGRELNATILKMHERELKN